MKSLTLIVVLATGLLHGCEGDSCSRGCDDDYDDCIDEGLSEDECSVLRSRCQDACEEQASESSEDGS